ncbi:MAG TPA: hypothetical protein PJ992_07175, partial [Arachnia sp.]|nr:hypothetical protein [Arachnia sp.]
PMTRQTTPVHPGVALRDRRRNLGLSLAEVAKSAAVDVKLLELVELGLRHPGDRWLDHVERVVANLEAGAR